MKTDLLSAPIFLLQIFFGKYYSKIKRGGEVQLECQKTHETKLLFYGKT